MKRIKLLIAAAVLTLQATQSLAQDTTKTLLHFPKIKQMGIYIAPEYQYGQLKNAFTSFTGVSGMLIFNKSFAIGASFQHSIYEGYSPKGISPLYLSGRFGGLKMEYTYNPNNVIHLSFPLTIGMGTAQTDSALHTRMAPDPMLRDGRNRFRPHGNTNDYFLIQPGAVVEANLFKTVKLYAGVAYRLSFDTYSTNSSSLIPASTLQGFSLNAGVKVGLFGLLRIKK